MPAGTQIVLTTYADSQGNYAACSTTLSPNSIITTVAGIGSEGYGGDNQAGEDKSGGPKSPSDGSCSCGLQFLRLKGGILGRTDDMIHLRGNNVYPSAIEAIIRRFPEVAEYRLEVDQTEALAVLRIEIEPTNAASNGVAERVDQAIREELLFRAEVRAVPPGSLPRFEMKARRMIIKK